MSLRDCAEMIIHKDADPRIVTARIASSIIGHNIDASHTADGE